MDEAKNPARTPPGFRWLIASAIIVASMIGAAAILIAIRWPFSRERTAASIQQALQARLETAHFRPLFFPHPGCIIKGLKVIRSNAKGETVLIASAQQAAIRTGYLDFILRPGYIDRIALDGVIVQIPTQGSTNARSAAREPSVSSGQSGGQSQKTPAQTMRVGEIVTNNAKLTIARAGGKAPLDFEIHSLVLHSVGSKDGLSYWVSMANALPPGELESTGKFGPWNQSDPEQTPLSGKYNFTHANLAAFSGISGTLSSTDEFEGSLGLVHVRGVVEVPDFKVRTAGSSVPLRAPFQATVDALKGNVDLQSVEASIRKTTIEARGRIAGQAGSPGKITTLDFAARNARIQDVLELFTKDKPPLDGTSNFRAHAVVRAFGQRFLKETNFRGQFEIADGRFTNPQTQSKVNNMSFRASRYKSKGDAPQVTCDLEGKVALVNGIAHLPDLSAQVPAAAVHFNGTYNLLNDKVDFHGTLRTDAEIAKTTKGIKSVLLTPLDPLFKKKSAGAVVPVAMTGTYHNPHFGLDLAPNHNAKSEQQR